MMEKVWREEGKGFAVFLLLLLGIPRNSTFSLVPTSDGVEQNNLFSFHL
jgi:hypothetical protein